MAIQAGDAVWTIRADDQTAAGLNSALNRVQGTTMNMTQAMGTVGRSMTAMGAAITAPLALGIKNTMDFGSAMAEVSTLGVQDLSTLGDAVKDVSATYGLDLLDAVEATYQALSASATEYETPQILAESAKAAAAGQSDLSTALQMGVQVASAFGIEYKDLNTVFNDVFLTIKYGITRFDDLAGSVGRVAPIFKGAGVSAHELFAAIAALTKGGLSTTEAVTALRGVMTAVISPTSEAAELADTLGLNFSATALKTEGLSGFIDLLNEAMANSSDAGLQQLAVNQQQIAALEAKGTLTKDEQKQLEALRGQQEMLNLTQGESIEQFAALFGNVRGLVGMLGLAGSQNEFYNKVLGETKTNLTAVDDAFQNIVKNDPSFAWRQLKAELQVLSTEIGTTLLPVLEKVVETLKPWIDGLAEWIRENEEFASGIIVSVGALGLFMLTLGPILMTLPGLAILFKAIAVLLGAGGVAGAAASAAPAIAGVGTAAATAAGATGVGALVAGLAAIAWPVAAGVAIVAGVTAIAYSVSATKKAFDDLEVSEQKSAAMGERYAQHLRDKGIAFNEAAMAAMGLSERVAYGAEAEKQAADTSARAWFQHFAGRAETEKEFANMRALMLNKNISAEEAAIAISKGMNEQAMRELMRADATKTEQILNSMGVLKQADQQSILDITKAEMDAAQERSNIWMQSTEQLVASEQQKAQHVAGIWSTTFGEILHGIMALPVMGGDLVRGLVGMPALGAMAAGGPVAANTPYLVGERGPELFQPSTSGRIFNHGETMGMLAGAGGGITINMGGVSLASNMDVDAVARRLGDKLRQRITGVGASNDWRR